ncbi:unnamed protein product [Rotaria sp. Silwood2]|nr:unnamed protein product [Rotaria sp. Silwood2]CAF3999791.1 unnamed protein product [Rotaria sp. Silwood2]
MNLSSPLARIDIHTHSLTNELNANAQEYLELRSHVDGDFRLNLFKDGMFFRTIEPHCFDINIRLREMDENNISMQVLSTIPVLFNYSSEKFQNVLELSLELNDHIAPGCRQHPTRSIGLGAVAPHLAINELRRCANELGLKGVQIVCEVEKLDACVFIHPQDMPTGKCYDAYWMLWLCGKISKFQLAFAPGSASSPFTVGCINHGHECRPDLCAYKNNHRPPSYIDRFYVDSLAHDSRVLKFLVEIMNEICVMLESDCPFSLAEDKLRELIVKTFNNDLDIFEKLLKRNATHLFYI